MKVPFVELRSLTVAPLSVTVTSQWKLDTDGSATAKALSGWRPIVMTPGRNSISGESARSLLMRNLAIGGPLGGAFSTCQQPGYLSSRIGIPTGGGLVKETG